jgi:hypothetical protein
LGLGSVAMLYLHDTKAENESSGLNRGMAPAQFN